VTIDAPVSTDWQAWLRRWDTQQAAYIPDRDARFEAMFDAVDVLLGERFVALDLGCGPGSLSQRLLARFPAARVVALDHDPVTLAIGRGALGDAGGRLRWVEADLNAPDWSSHLGETTFDAVLSTTALHWLRPGVLVAVYRRLAELLRPGGLFLDGDHLPYPPARARIARLAETVKQRRRERALAAPGVESWEAWWDAVAADPGLAGLHAERAHRFAGYRDGMLPLGYEFHVASLRDAGFREVDTIWPQFSNRVLLAVR